MNILSRNDLVLYKQTLSPGSVQYCEIERMLILGQGFQQLSTGDKVYLNPEWERLLGGGPLSDRALGLLQELTKAISSLVDAGRQISDADHDNRVKFAKETLANRKAEVNDCDNKIKNDIEEKIKSLVYQIRNIGNAQVETKKRLDDTNRQRSELQGKVDGIQAKISDINGFISNTTQQIEGVEDDEKKARRDYEKNMVVNVVVGGLFGPIAGVAKAVFDDRKYRDQVNNLRATLNAYNNTKQQQEADLNNAKAELQGFHASLSGLSGRIASLEQQQNELTIKLSDLGAVNTQMQLCKAAVFTAIDDVERIPIDSFTPDKYVRVESKITNANEAITRYEVALKAHSNQLA